MTRKKVTTKANQLTAQTAALTEFAAKALIAAEQLGAKTRAVVGFPLEETERAVVAHLLVLSAKIKSKLAKKNAKITVAETASIVMAVADSLLEGEPLKRLALQFIAKELIDCLAQSVVMPDLPAKAKKAKSTDTVYGFKITLLESAPPIWRRIQLQDCTLDKLHEYVQTAMGWTISYLHHFKVGEQLYGDPELMQKNFKELDYKDSTTTKISDILPKNGEQFRFEYEYDFGDSWEHEVLFEGVVQPVSKVKYPLCLEGARACPPEDCGGVFGYADFVEAIRNKNHEQHKEMLKWVGGRFDPEEFDPAIATKAMKKGLPDWGSMV